MATLKIGMLSLFWMIYCRTYTKGTIQNLLAFSANDGEITCKITGQGQRSVLLLGGLEIPCI